MNELEHIEYLKNQLHQTQMWLESESEARSEYVISMIIKGMIETETQIGNIEDKFERV